MGDYKQGSSVRWFFRHRGMLTGGKKYLRSSSVSFFLFFSSLLRLIWGTANSVWPQAGRSQSFSKTKFPFLFLFLLGVKWCLSCPVLPSFGSLSPAKLCNSALDTCTWPMRLHFLPPITGPPHKEERARCLMSNIVERICHIQFFSICPQCRT